MMGLTSLFGGGFGGSSSASTGDTSSAIRQGGINFGTSGNTTWILVAVALLAVVILMRGK